MPISWILLGPIQLYIGKIQSGTYFNFSEIFGLMKFLVLVVLKFGDILFVGKIDILFLVKSNLF